MTFWHSRPVGKYRNGIYFKTCQIMEGDEIKVESGSVQYLRDTELPTHRVINIDNYNLFVIDRHTLEPVMVDGNMEPYLI